MLDSPRELGDEASCAVRTFAEQSRSGIVLMDDVEYGNEDLSHKVGVCTPAISLSLGISSCIACAACLWSTLLCYSSGTVTIYKLTAQECNCCRLLTAGEWLEQQAMCSRLRLRSSAWQPWTEHLAALCVLLTACTLSCRTYLCSLSPCLTCTVLPSCPACPCLLRFARQDCRLLVSGVLLFPNLCC